MSAKEVGGPAFPVWELNGHGKPEMTGFGMDLRDYFAAKAMQARLTDYESCKSLVVNANARGISFAQDVAEQSYDMADAMLKARQA